VIEPHNVTKIYGTDVTALDRLTFTVDKGEFVFLTGPSGAGKSTLLRLLLRQEVPTEGTLTVGGRELATLRRVRCRRIAARSGSSSRTSAHPHEDRLRQRRLRDARVLGVPVEQQRRRTYQVLKGVGLQHRALAYPPELSAASSSASPSPARRERAAGRARR
jgi:cell division transport system ATP-binding protein